MILRALLILVFAAPVFSQTTVLLQEDFSSGIVPPAGWGETNNGISLGWEPRAGTAWHDDFAGANDNWLTTPVIDCSTVSQLYLHATQRVFFSTLRTQHAIEISTDGGATFSNVVDDQAGDGSSPLLVDLSAWAGQSNVVIGFRYVGNAASEWSLDDISITDRPTPPGPAILATLVNPANGHTYHLLESSNWTDAEAEAVALGGNLATINDQAENDWVWNNFSNWGGTDHDLWIGLNDVAVPGTFVWTSGDPSTFRYWAAGQPDNNGGNESYVHIGELNTDQWNDMFDSASTGWSPGYYGIVEISSGPPPNPTLSVTNLIAGQAATISVSNCSQNNVAYFVWSVSGGGPVGTPYGPGYVSPPFNVIPMPTDANGASAFNQNVPSGVSGLNIWFHGADSGTGTMLNPLAMTIG